MSVTKSSNVDDPGICTAGLLQKSHGIMSVYVPHIIGAAGTALD